VKLLLVSDLHYHLRQYDWLLHAAPRYDAVMIAGDLLDLGSLVEPDVQILVISRYLETLRAVTCTAVCSGNHDGDERIAAGGFSAAWLAELRGAGLHVDGDSFDLPGVRVSVCHWWEGTAERDALHEQLRIEHERLEKPLWVWLHHAPPKGSPVSWTGKADGGDPFLADMIDEFSPTLVLSGHIHYAPMVSGGSWHARHGQTTLFNAGSQIGPVPSSICIDLTSHTASYESYEESDEVRLDGLTQD
jgi:Icc-related predicted phosphoesterase